MLHFRVLWYWNIEVSGPVVESCSLSYIELGQQVDVDVDDSTAIVVRPDPRRESLDIFLCISGLSWVSRAGAAMDWLELSSSGGYLESELQRQLSVEAST